MRDFSFISLASNGPPVLMVRNGFRPRPRAGYDRHGEETAGKHKIQLSTNGSTDHPHDGQLFGLHTGVDIHHIPYKGGGPSVIALLGGEVDLVINDLSVILPAREKRRGLSLSRSRIQHASRRSRTCRRSPS
ncbi:MAG: hypothetical protein KIT18_00345 [Burkholderiales bacterium]|nr:hypothetical protein [Burkholderiales bacterium]